LQQLDLVLPWLAGFHDHLTLAANTTPSGAPAWKTLPSWAVIGTEDRIIPPGAQRRMAERAGATITEVNASHVSMVSRPRSVDRGDPRRRRRRGVTERSPAGPVSAATHRQTGRIVYRHC
jgi:hypothetical protein